MKYIVTGGAGFIGSHIVDSLINDGHEVIAIDDESATSNEEFYWNPGCIKAVENVCDYDKIEPLFKGVDTVFHLAAESRIQPAIENPVKATMTNAVGTCSVLQAARANNVSRVIYSSTSSAYGLKNDPPLTEEMPNDCLNPYSVTKVSGEELCKMYYKLFGLQTVIFRYFNVYGERQPLKGQYAPVVGIFLRQAENGEPMTIVGDGNQRRDFTHVSDVVRVNRLASTVKQIESCGHRYQLFGEIFNVGVGSNHNINEVAEMVGGDHVYIPSRPGEAETTLADISKTTRVLGWEPRVMLGDWLQKYKEKQNETN